MLRIVIVALSVLCLLSTSDVSKVTATNSTTTTTTTTNSTTTTTTTNSTTTTMTVSYATDTTVMLSSPQPYNSTTTTPQPSSNAIATITDNTTSSSSAPSNSSEFFTPQPSSNTTAPTNVSATITPSTDNSTNSSKPQLPTSTAVDTETISSTQPSVVITTKTPAEAVTNQCQQVPNVCKDPGSWCNQISEMTFECPCKPGFYNNSLSCEPALQFGGQLVYTDITTSMRASTKQASVSEVEDFVIPIYEKTDGYISVDNIVSTATFSSYVLLYEPTSTESAETIQNAMQDKLVNCQGSDCKVGSQELDKDKTIAASGTYSVAVCDQYEGYCDSISTICSTSDGSLYCNCKSGYVTMDGNSQYCKLDICNTDSDCNGPFGECVGSPGSCKCVFGFSGTHCRDPWLLVFITVGGSLLLILIAVLIAMCVSSSKSSKKSKSTVYQSGNNSSTLHENPFYDKKGNIPESTENVLKTFNYKFNGNMRATVPSNLNFDDENYKRRSHAPSERAGSNASDNRSYVPDSHYERNGRGHNNYMD